jgi:hypothetical protein
MFFIRAAFWLTLVIAFIPVNPEDLKDGQRPVTTGETILAAQAVIADLSGFCTRNPQTCGTGGELMSQLGAKATAGARYVYLFLEEKTNGQQPGDPIATGSVSKQSSIE